MQILSILAGSEGACVLVWQVGDPVHHFINLTLEAHLRHLLL